MREPIAPIVAVLETKPENNPAIARPIFGAERAQSDVAQAVDRHDQHREHPQLAQVDDAPRIDRLLGQQRQDHQRRRGEHQAVAHLLVGEDVLDPVVQRSAEREQDGDDDRERRRELRLAAPRDRRAGT